MLIRYPSREWQLQACKWFFLLSYLAIAITLTYILASIDGLMWVANMVFDVLLCLFFVFYSSCIHCKADHHDPTQWLLPRKAFFTFPAYMGFVLGFLLSVSLFAFRIPAIYYAYDKLSASDAVVSYDNTSLLIVLTILPIAFYSSYWSIGYMLFRKEFTASPGK